MTRAFGGLAAPIDAPTSTRNLPDSMEGRVEMKSTGYADSFSHGEHLAQANNEDLQKVGGFNLRSEIEGDLPVRATWKE